MKTNLTLLLFLFATATFAQTIRRVNADVTVTGTNVYTTIQAAHDAATAGDILIVEPGASVGNLNCIKTLIIYGRGYYLDKNPSFTNLPNNSFSSTVGNFSIFASNCKISGLYFASNIITINGGASGTTISRNNVSVINLQGSNGTTINNTTISQNSIGSAIDIRATTTGFISNTTISNNLIGYSVRFIENGGAQVTNPNLFTSTLVNQNTIAYISYGLGVNSFANAIFSNNIFYSPVTSSNSVAPSSALFTTTFSNNITFAPITIDLGLGANNIQLANTVGQFNSNTGGSADNNYRVATGSAMKTASSSGGEVGMFGGATPYVQYGIPATPSVIKLLNTGIGNSTTPITATVSATSNN